MIRAFTKLLALLVVLVLCGAPSLSSVDPKVLAKRIDSIELRAGAAMPIRNVRVNTGMAVVILEEGTLFPASPLADRTTEMVFLGRGRLTAAAPDEVEAGQLELFTGKRFLDVEFHEAVLVVTNDAAADALIGERRQTTPDRYTRDRAVEIFEEWKSSRERRRLNVPGALFLDGIGDPGMEGYFAAWFRSSELGDFVYIVDPDEPEQVTLGQFVDPELPDEERGSAIRRIHPRQPAGRRVGLEADPTMPWM